jgi:catechol 2,3-dioxygenase-like lactoylglutathione lyase family enzyme
MIEALSHLTFIVRDLDRMTALLETVFDAREVYASGDRTFSLSREKFFLIGDLWIAVMEGEPLPTRTYNHTAFKIAEPDLPLFRERVSSLGLELRESRPRVSGEGFSLYFYDHDNHLFELHTGTLSDRLARYAQGREAAA